MSSQLRSKRNLGMCTTPDPNHKTFTNILMQSVNYHGFTQNYIRQIVARHSYILAQLFMFPLASAIRSLATPNVFLLISYMHNIYVFLFMLNKNDALISLRIHGYTANTHIQWAGRTLERVTRRTRSYAADEHQRARTTAAKVHLHATDNKGGFTSQITSTRRLLIVTSNSKFFLFYSS